MIKCFMKYFCCCFYNEYDYEEKQEIKNEFLKYSSEGNRFIANQHL